MHDITYNDIQEFINQELSTGYQTDAIPYSPANKNANRCKRITTLLISYRTYYHIMLIHVFTLAALHRVKLITLHVARAKVLSWSCSAH